MIIVLQFKQLSNYKINRVIIIITILLIFFFNYTRSILNKKYYKLTKGKLIIPKYNIGEVLICIRICA